MNSRLLSLFALCLFPVLFGCNPGGSNSGSMREMKAWITNLDQSLLFAQQKVEDLNVKDDSVTVITIDDTKRYQEIDGFGYTLTGGSAIHLNGMNPGEREKLLKELFGTGDSSIGVSYLRLTIGASDLSDHVFSYNDLPAGETDPEMQKFSLDPERKDLLPVLKEILAINPNIKILGSPWSPPVWMKTNGDTRGGSLKPEFYDAYAKYFVRYVEEMKKEGVAIDAITIQNEPLHPGNNPSLLMYAAEQGAFIKQSLGPAFRDAGIKTKIILYDHNADRPDYPDSILNDPDARQYVDGSAFHLYGGQIDTLSWLHERHPDKNLYFTEQWVGAPGKFDEDFSWHIRTLIIGGTRNWCKNVLEWNLSNNAALTPFTDRGGCSQCLGAVTIEGNQITRNPAYYSIAHASLLVRPGSVRIHSDNHRDFPNVAFTRPDGKKVLIVQNNTNAEKAFRIKHKDETITTSLKAGSAGSYLW